jgi:hypothetical protein
MNEIVQIIIYGIMIVPFILVGLFLYSMLTFDEDMDG